MKRIAAILGAVFVLLLIAFAAFRVPDTDAAEMRAKYAGPPSRFVKLSGGLTVHLRDEGPRDAPVIVLLHGSNADLHTWDKWADGLKTDYRVVRFDQRGHGLTGAAPDGDYRTDAFADDVQRVADKLGLDRFVLAGNSMGGGIAARFAMLHPDRLRGLVLVDAGGAPITAKGEGNLGFRIAAIPVVGKLAFQVMPRSVIEKSLSQTVKNQAVVTPATVDRYWELGRYPGNRDATARRFALGRTPFAAAQVAAIHTPTLVMWGEKDPLIPYAAADWYMHHLPDAKLVHYPAVGHIPMEEAPARSLADLRRWLAALDADKRMPATGRMGE